MRVSPKNFQSIRMTHQQFTCRFFVYFIRVVLILSLSECIVPLISLLSTAAIFLDARRLARHPVGLPNIEKHVHTIPRTAMYFLHPPCIKTRHPPNLKIGISLLALLHKRHQGAAPILLSQMLQHLVKILHAGMYGKRKEEVESMFEHIHILMVCCRSLVKGATYNTCYYTRPTLR